ncbi:MAG: hypothetical protein Q8911_01190 [Bacillota bacterium]|nr:hypothetical protein [Bacillota bacterium]
MLEKLRKPALVVAVLGAAKLVTDAFGMPILTDESINAIANGVAAVATIVGILINRDAPQ